MPPEDDTLEGGVRRKDPPSFPESAFMKPMLLTSALLSLCAVFAASPAQAQLSVSAGGGWNAPRGDSTEYRTNGMRVQAGAELEAGPNLGFELSGAYGRLGLNGSKLKADLGLPAGNTLKSQTEVYEVSLLPKLYLLNRDIAAYALAGGGPRWVRQTVTSGPGGGTTSRNTEFCWGVSAGFGVDAAFSEDFRIGFAPVYHVAFADRGDLEYVEFLFYVKI